ncbi:MAG: hypothetical protein ACI4ON_01145 [Clostridia bacterium]
MSDKEKNNEQIPDLNEVKQIKKGYESLKDKALFKLNETKRLFNEKVNAVADKTKNFIDKHGKEILLTLFATTAIYGGINHIGNLTPNNKTVDSNTQDSGFVAGNTNPNAEDILNKKLKENGACIPGDDMVGEGDKECDNGNNENEYKKDDDVKKIKRKESQEDQKNINITEENIGELQNEAYTEEQANIKSPDDNIQNKKINSAINDGYIQQETTDGINSYASENNRQKIDTAVKEEKEANITKSQTEDEALEEQKQIMENNKAKSEKEDMKEMGDDDLTRLFNGESLER